MNIHNNTWAIVLAGGSGRRLHTLTTNESGVPVPKQFCSLQGGRSLLHDALARARVIASPERICVVVAEQHRRWWKPALANMPDRNIIVQPADCGTAIGILLPLLHIMARDSQARVLLLPSDHHARDELVLAAALERGMRALYDGCEQILLLGITPDDTDPELGYIMPGLVREGAPSSVIRFVEKPDLASARDLINAGALWNAFIMMASAATLLQVISRRFPQTVAGMRKAVAHDIDFPNEPDATAVLYKTLPNIDFSRQILAGEEAALCVLPVDPCGWSDLGTPKRLAKTLERLPLASTVSALRESANPIGGYLNLTRQHVRMMASDTAKAAASSSHEVTR